MTQLWVMDSLREEGHDGYIWTVSTLEVRVIRYGTRQTTMIDTILGDAFGGMVVSDFYAAYTHDVRMHQYCWAHLWPDLEELVLQHPRDPAVAGWVTSVGTIYQRAMADTGAPRDRWAIRRARQAYLRGVCAQWAQLEYEVLGRICDVRSRPRPMRSVSMKGQTGFSESTTCTFPGLGRW